MNQPRPGTALAVLDEYTIDRVPIRSGRVDWTVTPADTMTPADAPDFVAALRRFFADFDEQITAREHDPIATGTALTKVEALLGDLRYLAQRLRKVTAASLAAERVRRLTISSIGVLESSSTVNRSQWQTAELVAAFFRQRIRLMHAVTDDGELVSLDQLAALIGELYGSSTAPRITPLRDAGLDPDEFCTIERDEDDRVVRTPTVTVKVNEARS